MIPSYEGRKVGWETGTKGGGDGNEKIHLKGRERERESEGGEGVRRGAGGCSFLCLAFFSLSFSLFRDGFVKFLFLNFRALVSETFLCLFFLSVRGLDN